MKKKLNKNNGRWRTKTLWKPTVVCMMLLLLTVSNVQAATSAPEFEAKPVLELSAESVELDMMPTYKWVNSERELFTTTVNGHTRFVGIMATMRLPSFVETGHYYSIPVYFTRFEPRLTAVSNQPSVKPYFEKKDLDEEVSIQSKQLLPIDVFMCAGIGVSSCKITNTDSVNYLHIGIGVCDGDLWTYNVPIVLLETDDCSQDSALCVTGFDQKIWIQQPTYRYLTDIPLGEWDGPYFIRVRIDPLPHLNADDVALSDGYTPPPIPPAQLSADATETTISKENVKEVSSTVVSLEEYESTASYPLVKSILKSIKSVNLKEFDGEQLYQIKGIRESKLLWIIPVEIDVTIDIDIHTGEIITEERPWWGFLTS